MTAPVERPEVASWRLIVTLALAGALAGLLLVFVDQITAPVIAANEAAELREAVREVLKGPAKSETLYLHEGRLVAALPEGVEVGLEDRVYLGLDANGKRVGYAVVHREPGFQDFVKVIFGYDARGKTLMGMRVLESKETPGLGDKIFKDKAFVDQFDGMATPLTGVKIGAGKGKPGEVDMITGATISSKAVIRIINHALERWRPHIEAFDQS